MNSINNIFSIIIKFIGYIFIIIGVVLFFAIIFNPTYFNMGGIIDKDLATDFGIFFQGLVGTTASIAGSILIVSTFIFQNKQMKISQLENKFYKMLDYHRDNVKSINISDYRTSKKVNISGQRSFIIFRLQLMDCLEIVREINNDLKKKLDRNGRIDVGYMIFYYGINDKWERNDLHILKKYDNGLSQKIYKKVLENKMGKSKNIGRTNQTSLSAYFRNMFNAIMLIHNDKDLSKKQKKSYIKVLRSQLSNAEQAILYFNVMSRFGKKWKEYKLIEEYELIKNLPTGYCGDDYNFKDDFKINYEDDELELELELDEDIEPIEDKNELIPVDELYPDDPSEKK
ncbi:putative phage abortive infection protein [Breznakiella homolactica]|uniref:Putative phage abortive infection protein n=1 Tax=Breznakiella homolactica TaxID=2798577 RepID=A0A7T7XQ21_9SPIR|nr:putative phage abortive infection protein [Breznakiella homolactica]QQO10377.1 putative phage abortive infection protein [Breznakiella homolactica]